MKVALFASAFYPHVGGVEELVRQLAHTYLDIGLSPIVLTNRWPRSLPCYEEYEGIPVHRLAMRVPEGSLKARLNYRLTHRAIVSRMLGVLRQSETSLVHIQCVSSNGFYALLASRALGLPLLVSAQGERTMDADRIYEKSPFLNRTLRSLLAEADHVTACSRDTLEDIEGFSGRPLGPRASVIHNGVNLAEFASIQPFTHPRPYILGIGRMVIQKGFDVLLRAFAHGGHGGYDLLLAGDGVERTALEQMARQHGLGERVTFVGRADRRTAVSLFQGCAFFVLPSRSEPQGIVNLEAMAAGKPVIASRVGGVPEIVLDGETGMLVPCDDVVALSDAMARMGADEGLRHRLGDAGRRRAQQFDWPAIAGEYIRVYEEIMGTKSVARAITPLEGVGDN